MVSNLQTGFSRATPSPARPTKRVRQLEHMMDQGKVLEYDLFSFMKKRLTGILLLPSGT